MKVSENSRQNHGSEWEWSGPRQCDVKTGMSVACLHWPRVMCCVNEWVPFKCIGWGQHSPPVSGLWSSSYVLRPRMQPVWWELDTIHPGRYHFCLSSARAGLLWTWDETQTVESHPQPRSKLSALDGVFTVHHLFRCKYEGREGLGEKNEGGGSDKKEKPKTRN